MTRMTRQTICAIVLPTLATLLVLLFALLQSSSPRDLSLFKQLPILSEGRVMPLDTFARTALLSLNGKTKTIATETQKSMPAAAWLYQTILTPKDAYQLPVLHVATPNVQTVLNLPTAVKNRYTFTQIAQSLIHNSDLLTRINQILPELRTPDQQAIIALTQRHTTLFDLSRSLTLFSADNSVLDAQTSLFKIIPTQNNNWHSLWSATSSGLITPNKTDLVTAWKTFPQSLPHIQTETLNHSQNIQSWRLKLEVFYNHLAPFKTNLTLYIIALATILLAIFSPLKRLTIFAQITLTTALSLHFIGIALRIFIMQRPPIATLYESIITTSFITVLTLYFFYKKQDVKLSILLASTAGTVLQFISLRYVFDGNSMGTLVAVLNTNFWLATHVVSMIFGYAFALVAAIQAHVYLFMRAKNGRSENLEIMLKNTLGMCLVALLFNTLGTVLGGIWADQSWGRFWGWDPKENGALLIILWLILITHARFKTISALTFMAATAALGIIVALAWFGVNLLGVGLHSYGFTEGIALKLALYCSINSVLILALWWLCHCKESSTNAR